uniref:Family with sequence similarity 13 member B n=1 Tax=Paramormyrops kingsleyae TaxID=1676925 RepID=A0A3B3Q656_9TELE
MRKSFSPALGDSLSTARVFGIPLEEVRRSGQPGQEVPLLVKHIVEYIEEHGGLDLEGLFMVNGNAERVEWLRQRYDSGEEVDLEKEADLASAVSLLRLFLQELPEPVIPANLQAHILQLYQGYNNEEELAKNIKYFLQQLPQVNYSLLRFLCRFLSSVASLQEESWSIAGLAAVFGPDVFHLDTDVEDLKEQESVSRVLTELLESPEDYFDSEDDDVSTTNDYSSINEQITELLDDDKLEPCEELPPDGVESLPADEVRLSQVTPSSRILQRTIRAAVQQHLLDLKSSIGQEISSYEGQGLSSQLCHGEEHPAEPATESAEGSGELVTLCATQVTPVGEHQDVQNPQSDCAALEESVGMDLDTRALVDAENNITTGRWDNCQVCEMIDGVNINTCTFGQEGCDLNANSELRECPGQPSSTATALDLRGIFIEREWEDPVPAFMSWQEDSESGEAQLSPLAGRMVPPPLGDNALQLQARHFLDFGHSQRFLHQDPDGVSPAKALPCGSHRPRRSSFSSKESMKGDAVSHQLTKKLQNLKKKIRQFEEQFEKDRNYKPSYGDKAANPKVFKWMTDLTKTRRQLKDAKQKVEAELAPQTRPRSNTLPKSFGSTLEQVAHDGGSDRRVTREETLELIQRRVRDKREEDRWPEDVRKMSKEQLSCEKMVLQRNLLHYEGLHGRPATREERLIVKPLYDRYRLVKQMLARASITPLTASPSSKRRSQTLQPIIEGETAHFCDEIKEEEEDEEDEEIGGELSELEVVIAPDPAAEPGSPQVRSDSLVRPKTEDKLALDLRLSSSNAASKPELLEQLWKARAEKKKLRKTIRDFEEDFYQQNGRNVQKEDRAPMIDEYKEYKRVKAKLRLLEVLISKQDSSKSI